MSGCFYAMSFIAVFILTACFFLLLAYSIFHPPV